jgi:hypothetical protein
MLTVKHSGISRAERRADREKRLDIYEGLCEVAAMERRAAARAELGELTKVDARELSPKKYEIFKRNVVRAIARGGAR